MFDIFTFAHGSQSVVLPVEDGLIRPDGEHLSYQLMVADFGADNYPPPPPK